MGGCDFVLLLIRGARQMLEGGHLFRTGVEGGEDDSTYRNAGASQRDQTQPGSFSDHRGGIAGCCPGWDVRSTSGLASLSITVWTCTVTA